MIRIIYKNIEENEDKIISNDNIELINKNKNSYIDLIKDYTENNY
jgi:hypothetical protein